MPQLVLLKRSDADVVLMACCEHMGHATALAAELSNMQAFGVSICAILPTLGSRKGEIHKALAASHVRNGWYAARLSKILQVASAFLDTPLCPQAAQVELKEVKLDSREPCVAGEAVAREIPIAKESVALETHTAERNATPEKPHFNELQRQAKEGQTDPSRLATNAAFACEPWRQDSGEIDAATPDDAQAIVQPCALNSQDEGGLLQSREPPEENAATLLVPCARSDAGTAHSITEVLQKKLGRDAAAALLKRYRQAVT